MIALLAFISLTTPAMLAGMGLLALPVVAHLLNRRVRRVIHFPSIMLLLASAASQSSLFRLRRWLLLLLRCLTAALIVLAFARPLWVSGQSPGAAGAEKSVGLVLVVDASASTGQRHGGVALFQAIRAAGQRAIDQLSPGRDMADVIYATAQPRASFPTLGLNLPALRSELGESQPSPQRADFPGAFALAGQLLAAHDGPRRLVILTDLQATNWIETKAGAALRDMLPGDTEVEVPDVGQAAVANVGLARPRCVPAQPIVGQPFEVAVEVTNYSTQKTSTTVEARLDGNELEPQEARLQPWETKELAFEARLDPKSLAGGSGLGAASTVRDTSTTEPVGAHKVEFSIRPDDLPADDHAYLVIDAVKRSRAVVVGDDDAKLPGGATYFLVRALAPRQDESDPYDVLRIHSGDIRPELLAGAAAVFISDIGRLDSGRAKILADYVRRGGGLVILCGAGPVAENLAILDAQGGTAGLLPWVAGSVRRDLTGNDEALHVTDGAWQSRLLRKFDLASQAALGHVEIRRVWPVANPRADAQVLLRYDDGTAALARRAAGDGVILAGNFSGALEAGDFGKYGSFVALVQSMASEVGAAAKAQRPALAGEALHFSCAATDDPVSHPVTVVGPTGQPVIADVVAHAMDVDIAAANPELTGFYSVFQEGMVIGTVAVNLDPRESDPRLADRADLLSRLRPTEQNSMAAGTGGPGGAGGATPLPSVRTVPLWGWLLAGAMVLLAAELIALGIWKQ